MSNQHILGPGETFALSPVRQFVTADASYSAGDLVAVRPNTTTGKFTICTDPTTIDLRYGIFCVLEQDITSTTKALACFRGQTSMFCKSSNGTSVAAALSPYTAKATNDGELDEITAVPRKIIALDILGSGTLSATRAKRDVLFNGIEGFGLMYGPSAGNPFSRLIDTNTAVSAAVAGTGAETNFDKTISVPVGFFSAAKRMIRFTFTGQYSDTGTPTLLLNLKFGTQVVCAIQSAALGSGVSNKQWRAVVDVKCTVPGATGTIVANVVEASFDTAPVGTVITAVSSFDLTAGYTAAVSAMWSASSASNTTVMEHFSAEAMA